jgi:hypothetical protein
LASVVPVVDDHSVLTAANTTAEGRNFQLAASSVEGFFLCLASAVPVVYDHSVKDIRYHQGDIR